ncbi:MAG: DNA polymerase III subunit gamma/tau [Solirubrobacteraceae bacterium]
MPETPSLYRRHRPRSFEQVVGQEHVVRTLRNAVEREKVHHAYLFVGSRGTGKTSMAKILAACLNCERGPTTSPCGVCESCVSIASATSLDVIEMDAASNNSVDDIRELRERVGLAPVSGRHKVYILDEAHMLSPQAWNAFLKTLEEPPPSTIFVLATTEAQKVLPTVVDRCHRFDFGRPSAEQIGEVIRRVAAQEAIELPGAAVGLIARGATGSFRDALGTLEQLVTYSGTSIELDDVLAVLGVADADLLFGALDAIAAHDAREALLSVARLDESGRDAGQLLRDLEGHGRELLVVRTLGELPAGLRMTAEHDERLLAQAQRLTTADVTRVLDLVAAAQDAVKNGADPRIQLELALVKAARPDADVSTQALLARVERLEARLADGAGSRPAGEPPSPPDLTGEVAAARVALRAEPLRSTPSSEEGATAAGAEGGTTAAAPATAAAGAGTPASAVAPAVGTAGLPAARAAGGSLASDLEGLRSVWPAVLETLRERGGSLKAGIFAEARPASLADGQLVVAFPPSATFKKRKAQDREYCEALADAVRAVTGAEIRLRCELGEEDDGEEAGVAGSLSDEELVARFMTEFDAEEIPADPEEGKD